MSIVSYANKYIFLNVLSVSIYLCHTNYSSKETMQMKTILLWNPMYQSADYMFGFGSQPFIKHNCNVTRCYMTNRRNYTAIEDFDAIVFHGIWSNEVSFPAARSPHQTYVYYTYESPAKVTIVHNNFAGVFNVTVSYRLDADIQYQYIAMTDLRGNVVSPTVTPEWSIPTSRFTHKRRYENIYKSKSKPIAWFATTCPSKGGREEYVKVLQLYLPVDIYGLCGPLRCPHDSKQCAKMLKKDYYFYLAFENSLCKDYVTEKVLTAYKNDVVPVVYGGADLDRFLPPMSYIDATKYHPRHLSALLKSLMGSQQRYSKYFWWREFYRLVQPVPAFCSLCEMLHDPQRKPKQYDDFSTWWNGNETDQICKDGRQMLLEKNYTRIYD